MPQPFIEVYHPDLDAAARIPVKSLSARQAKGWVPLDDSPLPALDPDLDDHPVASEPVPEGTLTDTPIEEG